VVNGGRAKRLTQKQIAELAGVSQATVSLVLSGRTDTTTRISESTRQRVLELLQETAYTADPAARMLAGQSNNLLGVFTYEPAFPNESADFYVPLLTGVESAAEELGADLLVFTSARVTGGRRKLLEPGTRLRLADGCVLLGREMDAQELKDLVELDYPFVAVGRRDADARVPYVGVDYVSAVSDLTTAALRRGHRDVLYLRLPYRAESTADRLEGFAAALASWSGVVDHEIVECGTAAAAIAAARGTNATVVLIEDPTHARRVVEALADAGVEVPGDISVIALGGQPPEQEEGPALTRLVAPRTELGAEAVRLLWRLLNDADDVPADARRVLLACRIVEGATLGPAAPRPAR
jgi:DNA-binding LacI/PurR family transcriptional regulator